MKIEVAACRYDEAPYSGRGGGLTHPSLTSSLIDLCTSQRRNVQDGTSSVTYYCSMHLGFSLQEKAFHLLWHFI